MTDWMRPKRPNTKCSIRFFWDWILEQKQKRDIWLKKKKKKVKLNKASSLADGRGMLELVKRHESNSAYSVFIEKLRSRLNYVCAQ